MQARDGCRWVCSVSVKPFFTGQSRTSIMDSTISLEDLIRELDKIQANQVALRDAISHDKVSALTTWIDNSHVAIPNLR